MIDCSKIHGHLIGDMHHLVSQAKDHLKLDWRGFHDKTKLAIPKLAVLLSRTDPAGELYLRSLKRMAEPFGISIEAVSFSDTESLNKKIHRLNKEKKCNGILLMRNVGKISILPNFIRAKNAIAPHKDVEGSESADDMKKVSCAAKACVEIICSHTILAGKNVVIVGYSKVGKPLACLLMRKYAGSVTTTHKYTTNLYDHLDRAEIIVSAVGKPHFLNFVCRPSQIIIDAGMSQDANNQLVGDVHPDVVRTAQVTPVPGGVGPITSLLILKNVILSALGKF